MADSSSLDMDAEFHERLRRYEEQMHPEYALKFDGAKLTLEENGRAIASWPAVSGRAGLQGQQHQLWRDHGPLPKGNYGITVDEIQEISDWDDLKGRVGIPNWRGGRPSWGTIAHG